jgi:hypothetical protein
MNDDSHLGSTTTRVGQLRRPQNMSKLIKLGIENVVKVFFLKYAFLFHPQFVLVTLTQSVYMMTS